MAGATFDADGNKQAVVAITFRWTKRFTTNWYDPLTFFACAFSDQLFNPQSQPRQFLVGNNRQLVTTGARAFRHGRAQDGGGVLIDGNCNSATFRSGHRAL